jgi:hypothetical protein
LAVLSSAIRQKLNRFRKQTQGCKYEPPVMLQINRMYSARHRRDKRNQKTASHFSDCDLCFSSNLPENRFTLFRLRSLFFAQFAGKPLHTFPIAL